MIAKRFIRISYFTMLTILGGLIRFPFPGTPIMFTLQTLFVISSGLMLGASDGAASQILYTLLGLFGLPIFSRGGGFSYILQPSFGYVFSFFIGAYVSGKLLKKCRTLSVLKVFCCALAGLGLIYVIGIIYQLLIVVFYQGDTFTHAISAIPSMLIMFLIDAALIFMLCLIYPKAMTMMEIYDTQQKNAVVEVPKPVNEPNGGGKKKEKKKKGKAPVPEPVGDIKINNF